MSLRLSGEAVVVGQEVAGYGVAVRQIGMGGFRTISSHFVSSY